MNRGKIYKKLSSRDKIPSQFSKLNVDQAHGWLGIDFRVPFALHNEIKGSTLASKVQQFLQK